jgi:hypothetical protein|tara:strand:- start:2901 stop:4022 length:1122 start_codon:yes stop_codon:yes gene_type:complete
MGTTTFSGPVRSENNFDLVSKEAATGLMQNRTVYGGGAFDTRRYYATQYFDVGLPKLSSYMAGSETKDWGSIADGDELSEDVTVTGAALGDFAVASMSIDVTDLIITASVTAANVVTVMLSNNTGGAIDLGSGTLFVRAIPKAFMPNNGADPHFMAVGTNMTSALVTRNATRAGIIATTATADQDQAIICPNSGTAETGWADTIWGTENQLDWECSISLPALDDQKVWAGLKLTNDQLVATDANQAYFKYQTDATNSEAFTDFTLWHFVHSIGGTDFISALPITVAAETEYHFRIQINSAREAAIFVDGVQYDVTATSGSTGGTSVASGTDRTAALTNDIDFIPFIGIEAGAAAAEALQIHYTTISRELFESS